MKPGVTGDWSVRDILAHVTTWEEEALTHLPLILEGGTPPRYSVKYGGIDAFNARMTEQKARLSLSAVRRQLDGTHRRLIDFIQRAPEDQQSREPRFRRRLRLDTYSHYPQHAEAIRKWREPRPLHRPPEPRDRPPGSRAPGQRGLPHAGVGPAIGGRGRRSSPPRPPFFYSSPRHPTP